MEYNTWREKNEQRNTIIKERHGILREKPICKAAQVTRRNISQGNKAEKM